jgi:hypothetical protein
MRFKEMLQLPGAGRARAGHYHGSHTPTSSGAVILGKMAYHTKQIRRQCIKSFTFTNSSLPQIEMIDIGHKSLLIIIGPYFRLKMAKQK